MNEIRLLTTCKTNSKWIAELSIRILEENIGGKFLEAGLVMIPLGITSKVWVIKVKVNKWNCIRLKIVYTKSEATK